MARTPFKLRSGNSTPFKTMGSSPVKQHSQEEEEVVVTKPEEEVEVRNIDKDAVNQSTGHPLSDDDVVRAQRFSSVGTTESLAQAEKNKAARKAAITSTVTDVRGYSTKKLNQMIKAQKEHLKSVDESGGKDKPGLFASKRKKQAWLSAQLMKGIDTGSYYEGGETGRWSDPQ